MNNVPKISVDELQSVLKKMSNRKCADTRRMVAELLKHTSRALLQMIADMFNDILAQDSQVPSCWQQNILKVLSKKGDTTSVENYRLIAILPILYKVFARRSVHG